MMARGAAAVTLALSGLCTLRFGTSLPTPGDDAAAAAIPRDESLISVFGSSVAAGHFCTGNCSGRSLASTAVEGGCYQSKLRVYQASCCQRQVVNNAVYGDCTTDALARFSDVINSRAKYVFVGFSLANEGLVDPFLYDTAVYSSYQNGMDRIIERIRKINAEPIIGLCYPNGMYLADDRELVVKMNLWIQEKNVPSVGFYGATSSPSGHWKWGYKADEWHPNDFGSTAMFHSIVPSVFDAIKMGKKPVPYKTITGKFLAVAAAESERVQNAPLTATVGGVPIWSLSYGLSVRTNSGEGSGCVAAALSGRQEVLALHIGEDGVPSVNLYGRGRGLTKYRQSERRIDDGEWHELVVTHQGGNGHTVLYVDGLPAVTGDMSEGKTDEFSTFVLGGGFGARPSPAAADYRDWQVWRTELAPHEVRAMHARGLTLQASMEVYAKLDPDNAKENSAQSLTEIQCAYCDARAEV